MNRILFVFVGMLLTFFSFPIQAQETAPAANPFSLTTNGFLDQGAMPTLYSCDGKDISPELTWADVPAKAQSLALIFTDPDAPNGPFYHWVVFNIPKSTTTLTQGIEKMPAGVMLGKNSFNKTQYNGPCPPKGTAHNYIFTLYALDTKLSVPAGADAKTVLDAMQKHIVAKAELSAVYSRWIN